MTTPPGEEENLNDKTMRIANELVAACFGEGMITKYIFLGEMIDKDGRRLFFSDTSPDIRAWESLGILELATIRERNRLLINKMDGEDT